jgi:acetyl-CoA carboxylase carboxyltransferase component
MPEEDPRILELREKRAELKLAGGEDRIAKQHAKGKLTARERLELLLDPGSFQELEPFVTQRADLAAGGDRCLSDGVVTGFGQIEGRTVYAYAQDFTIGGGALGEMTSHKICRVMDLAVRNGSPIVGLIDSGGARIQEGIFSLAGYAEIFRRNAMYSGIVPQISVIMGPCAGGASYSPALTDLIIMVEMQAYMFLTGPEVIKSVTGEIVDSESLGGAEVHMGTSGTAHFTVSKDQEGLELVRKILAYLPSNNEENPQPAKSKDDPARADQALNEIVPMDPRMPYNMHEVVEMVVDKGSFLELQAAFAQNALVGLARMDGQPVGVIGQEPSFMAGVIDINATDKICRFVRFCDCYNIPLVTFVDSPGFLPGVGQEHQGIIRHGAKVLFAYTEASVPKVSIVTRKAYGGAYIVMSSKPLGADVAFAWPSAEIAVMGPEGAANILYRKEIEASADPAAERAKKVEEFRKQFLNPYVAASVGHIDDVIEPKETRARVIKALDALKNKTVQALPRKHGNMPF